MNIFTRIWTVITSNVHNWLNRLEDPERMLDQSIREMQKQVEHVRGDVIQVIAEEKKLKSQIEKYQKEVERWEKNAMMALREGKDTLAREALRRKKESSEFTQQLRPQWERQIAISAKVKEEYMQLRAKIETAQHKRRNLITRLRHAETQKRLQGMMTDLADGRAFERFESKLLDTETQVEAMQELQSSSLDQQFAALTGANDMNIEQELAALKERMKLNP